MNYQAMLYTAIQAARSASHVLIDYLKQIESIKIHQKASNDFVTEVDCKAEQQIITTLSNAYPDHAFWGEEGGRQNYSPTNKTLQPVWIIDPLDGTTNFLHKVEHFSISIALQYQNIIRLGVIYDPIRDELFSAIRGNGAKLNDRRIRVSQYTQLRHCLIATGFPYSSYQRLDPYLAILKDCITQTAGIRRLGSAALDMAHTATGRFDGFWEFGLKPWDIAAGTLIVQEAGGLVSDFANQDDYLTTGDIVCASPPIHQALLKIIQGKLNK